MKKWSLIAAAAMLLAVLAGCGGSGAASAALEDGTQAVGNASSAQTEEPPEEAGAPEASDPEAQEETDQEFTDMELEISEGALYVRAGDAFSLTRRDGKDVDYEISGGVLYAADSRTGDVVLTLPEDGSYGTLRLTVKNGHAYVESALTLQSLELEMDRGEAALEEMSVEESSVLNVRQGSAFLSGDLGQSVAADCREGQLSLEVSAAKEEYNYTIQVSEGNIRLGNAHYSGKRYSETLDNGAERTMDLTCSRGDLSVSLEG